ncbi:unnamed protein product [Trichobilharzia szidati]|nr:unnamed protein product [Trichobilharzia szidati]
MNGIQQSSSVPSTSSPHAENLSPNHPNPDETSNHVIQEEGEEEEEYEDNDENITNHHNLVNTSGKVCGAAFNTLPIYDPQGSLVGLQTPVDRNMLEEFNNEGRNGPFVYNTSLQSAYYNQHHPQYNLTVQQNASIIPTDYNIPYAAYTTNPLNRHLCTPLPCQQQQQQQQYYQQNYSHILNHQQTQQQQQQQNQQQSYFVHQYQPQAAKAFLVRSASAIVGVDQNGYNNPEIFKPLSSEETFDKCPIVCSLFAIFCCPITIWCSVPALAYSLCAYTDYRASDVNRYRRKSDIARHLVITACIVGLLLCLTWGILTFFYYEFMLSVFNDVIRVVSHRIRSGT